MQLRTYNVAFGDIRERLGDVFLVDEGLRKCPLTLLALQLLGLRPRVRMVVTS